jgi:hypothetical protein
MLAAVLASLSRLVGVDSPERQVYPRVGPGIEYAHRQIGDKPWAVFVVKIDRARDDLGWATTLANGTVTGLSTVSDQTRAFPRRRGTPVVAVNADFFVIRPGSYQGDPSGLHIVNGEVVSIPIGTSFWIDARGGPHCNDVRADFEVRWPDGAQTRFGLNSARGGARAVLYTPTFGESTRTSGGRELVLEPAGGGVWPPLRVGETYEARVRAVREAGDTPLSPRTMVLSIGPRLAPKIPAVKAGDALRVTVATRPDLTGVEFAIGGGPPLVRNRKSLREASADEPRHPRTALGWNDTHYFLVVVDGRQTGYSIGMTFSELADFCLVLGCTDALNLDGGGSSTLWIDGQVVNRPSDGRERHVANALLVYRKPP